MKSKTSATLMLILTFILGGIAGAVAYSIYDTHVAAPARRAGARSAPHNIVEEMARGLSLDADQKEKLKVIISKSRERYRSLSVQFRPQYDVIRDETRNEIRQILTEEQKARFDKKVREIDERHKTHNHKGPG